MSEIDFSELVSRFAKDGPDAGSVVHVLEAGAAIANAIAIGMGPMIRGTFMEADFRNALKLREGESVNFRRSKSQHKRIATQRGAQGKKDDPR